ncbi:poly-gamma-glutamate synthase PgsB [Nosocomiicoccus ampullae]|uniref:poly-gamma-glutamate synthase PgsB n=1 Tax=Nosocomiicoccus ampullae TaxID=489910 RepID=UPI003C6E608B
MYLIIGLTIIFLVLGMLDKYLHNRRLKRVPLRININGVRGKSTITRLTYSILREAGYKVVGKTTGTDARLLYWYQNEEVPIVRKPQGANIGEQREIISKTVKSGAKAIVNECMAVNPDYQKVFQQDLLKANVGAIVNVMEDHMDVLGPTLDEVAESFVATIPNNGHLVVLKGHYEELFKKEAKKRNTEIIIADPSEVSEEYLKEFPYLIFAENVAIALGISRVLGIDDDIAYRGMLKAPPDSGAVDIVPYVSNGTNNIFVNAFAANEPTSSKAILKKIEASGYEYESKVLLLNCRSDRVDRTRQFVEDFLPNVQFDALICTGKSTQMVTDFMKHRNETYVNLEGKSNEDVLNEILNISRNILLFCVGNIHGPGKTIIQYMEDLKE